MKTLTFALLIVMIAALMAAPAFACTYGAAGYGAFASYGASYGASYAQNYYAPTYGYFSVVPPVQAEIGVSQTTTTTTTTSFVPPQPQVQYSYSPPLSTIVQYSLPLYAPIQPYYANYGFHGTVSRGFRYR